MPNNTEHNTTNGLKPLTEGYQPGSQLQRGYVPLATAKPGSPPSGGSSASKPAQTPPARPQGGQ